jgi:hypothetical protein
MRKKTPSANDNAAPSARVVATHARSAYGAAAEAADEVETQLEMVRAFLRRLDDPDRDLYGSDLDLLKSVAGLLWADLHERRAAVVRTILASLKSGEGARQVAAAAREVEPTLAAQLRLEDLRAIEDGRASERHAASVAARLATLSGALAFPRCRRESPEFEQRIDRATEAFRKSARDRAPTPPRRSRVR